MAMDSEGLVSRLRRLAASPYADDIERRETAMALLREYVDNPSRDDASWGAVVVLMRAQYDLQRLTGNEYDPWHKEVVEALGHLEWALKAAREPHDPDGAG
jgi:hypothetical protein